MIISHQERARKGWPMNRMHTLSNEEIRALEQLHRETDVADVRSRCDMILWSNEGLSPPQIAKRLRFSRYTGWADHIA
jgi:hypothetical protein